MATLSTPGGLTLVRSQIKQRVDWWLLLASALLLTMGLMALFSEGAARGGELYFRKQALNVAIGIVPFLLFAIVDPTLWARIAKPLYALNVVVLLAVLKFGSKHGGADRWIDIGPFQFQPSEMAKLLTVLTLATFLAKNESSIKTLPTFLKSVGHVAVPVALILAQPHLGATLVLLVIWCAMTLVARVPRKFVLGAMASAVLLLGLGSFLARSGGPIHVYQLQRLFALFGRGDKNSIYQWTMAENAFGVGGVLGSGYLHGEAGKNVPDQHTDFIFSVIGEEGGLVGCTLVLAAFGFFFYRVWLTILHAHEPFFRYVGAGLLAMLAFHAIVNLAMVLQLFPVVGLWLPFMSYGGTAVWLCMASVGLLVNLRGRERPILF